MDAWTFTFSPDYQCALETLARRRAIDVLFSTYELRLTMMGATDGETKSGAVQQRRGEHGPGV